jgi:hypothetical protein
MRACMRAVPTRLPTLIFMCACVQNTASRMESTGVPGAIHVSRAVRDLVPGEAWEATGGVQVRAWHLGSVNALDESLLQLEALLVSVQAAGAGGGLFGSGRIPSCSGCGVKSSWTLPLLSLLQAKGKGLLQTYLLRV